MTRLVRMRALGLVALFVSASTAVVRPQTLAPPLARPAADTGAISGIVTDGETKRPVAGALVRLLTVTAPGTGVAQLRPRETTDASGRFVFQQLAAGVYSVAVSAPGYLDWGTGGVRDSGTVGQVALQDRQWFGDANVALWRPGSISGTIRDERGEPLVDIPVRILMAFKLAGSDQWAAGTVTRTDDRGAYRFAGLRPGRYVVLIPSIQITLPDGEVALYTDTFTTKPNPLSAIRGSDGVATSVGFFAVPPSGHGHIYPATFTGAARSLSTADVIAVGFGTHRTAVDVSLIPVSSVRVSGIVSGPAVAISNLPVRLLAMGNESLGVGGETALTKT